MGIEKFTTKKSIFIFRVSVQKKFSVQNVTLYAQSKFYASMIELWNGKIIFMSALKFSWTIYGETEILRWRWILGIQ